MKGTKRHTYRPTKVEEKLLMALSDPENRMLNVVDLCNKIGIGRRTYYRVFQKKDFMEIASQLGVEVLKKQSVPLVHVAIQKALGGSFPHWKVLMEMSGLLNEGAQKYEEQITVRFLSSKSTE